MANIEEKVEELLKTSIENLGYELYDVEYAKEGPNYYLRIFIDKPEGIDIDDCEKVNNEIDPILDNADYIKDMYFLEVSSPGIERNLRKEKHLQANIGKKVEIHLFEIIEKKKIWTGTLENYNKEEIEIKEEEKIIKLPRNKISNIKTVYDW